MEKHQTFLGSGEIFGVCHLGSQASVLLQNNKQKADNKKSEEETKGRWDAKKSASEGE